MKRIKYFVSASFLGLVLGGLGLYYTVRGNRTHLSIDIAAESNVFDVRHPIPDLAILFQGKDIEESKSNLRVLTIRVINDGEANIHENDFDSRTPFGLKIDGGRIVRAQVTGSNSSYLAENLHPQVQAPDRITFDKIIFDKDRFIAVEAVILHQKSAPPHITPLGKIAGLDSISVTNSFQDRDHQSFWEQVFHGTPQVQITRGIAYAFITLVSVVALGFTIAGLVAVPGGWKRRKRQRRASRLPAHSDPETEKIRKVVERIFLEHGLAGLTRAQRSLASDEALILMLAKSNPYGRPAYSTSTDAEDAIIVRRNQNITHNGANTVLYPLFTEHFITVVDGKVRMDGRVRPALITFIEQITSNEDEDD